MIIAIDPGNVTGVATYEGTTFDSFEIDEIGKVYSYLWDVKARADVIIIEKFTINPTTHKKSRQSDPLMIIGFVDGLTYLHRIPLTYFTPAKAKSFATDDKLRAVGWWRPTPGGHANDAARHLLTFIAQNKKAAWNTLHEPDNSLEEAR